MKRTRLRRTKHFSNLGIEIKTNWKFFFLSIVLLLGMLIGSLVVRFGGATDRVATMFSTYFLNRSGQSFLVTAGYSALAILPFFAAAFLSGICLCGAPVCVMIPLFRGMGLGLMASYIYSSYGLKGVAFYTLIILPPSFISSLSLILACRESLSLSSMLFSMGLPKSQPFKLWNDIKIYCKRYLFILIVVLISVVVDAVMTCVFIKFFTF